MKITLIQTKYPHGGGRKQQIYLPGGLMNLGSRLMAVGMNVAFIDLNNDRWQNHLHDLNTSDVIGFTVLGAPYIPEVIKVIREMRKACMPQKILVGGEGVVRLPPEDFDRWFAGLNAVQIRNDADITTHCKIDPFTLPSMYETSMVPMLRQLSVQKLFEYFGREWCLFMSQGCAFNCSFCAASKARKEQYHSLGAIREEIEYIASFLEEIGEKDLHIYLSNLDAFQTPQELESRLKIVHEICMRYGITPHVRCLATSRCTFVACQKDPKLPVRLRGYGLEVVGFGADGADETAWKRQHKEHNSLSEIEIAVAAMEKSGIKVELLMVVGFIEDGFDAMWKALKFSFWQARKHRTIRPYLAKSRTPSGTWQRGDAIVEGFQKDPTSLRRLDYAMLGSKQTHPRRIQRWMANGVYLTIIGLLSPFGKCLTRPLLPEPNGFGRWIAELVNAWMPVDR